MVGNLSKLKLKPSARDNRRYFVVSCKDEKVIEKVLLEYLGVLGFAKSNYFFVKKDKNGFVVGSCVREELDDVRAGFGLAGFRITKVSGTIKGLKL